MYIWLLAWNLGLPLPFLSIVALTALMLKVAPRLGAVTELKAGGGSVEGWMVGVGNSH